MSWISLCTFTNCSSLLQNVARVSKRIDVSSESAPERSWNFGHLQLMLMGISVYKWAGWARDLAQVYLWKEILNYDMKSFGLGCVCSFRGLEDFYRDLISLKQHGAVLRGWVCSSWIYPVLLHWACYVFFLACRGPIYKMKSLHQETVVQTFLLNNRSHKGKRFTLWSTCTYACTNTHRVTLIMTYSLNIHPLKKTFFKMSCFSSQEGQAYPFHFMDASWGVWVMSLEPFQSLI